ncbi:hypothetical protein SDC9_56741 [bioreactor metagenome]|uniref:Uncharacterized protein n=1 Tax=bioreactor metagenome TaxID=1076179 RepID=A0A644X2V5_9ZZZZ
MNKLEIAEKLIKEILYYSEKANNYLFEIDKDTHETRYNRLDKTYREDRREIVSGIMLNKAISSAGTLKAFYYSNLDELEGSPVDTILNNFDLYSNEFFKNLSTKHSHQHTDVYFQQFKDSVANFSYFFS